MVEIRWLEDLLVLAQTRSFRKAAEQCHVTQPGLSRRIQSLERWATAALIDRRTAPMELTEHGKSLASIAADVVKQLKKQQLSFIQEKKADSRRLVIAAPGILCDFFLRWIPVVEQAIGEVNLTIVSDHQHQCCVALEEGRVDLQICMLDRDGLIMRRLERQLPSEPEYFAIIGEDALLPMSVPDKNGKPRHPIGSDYPSKFVGYATQDFQLGRTASRVGSA